MISGSLDKSRGVLPSLLVTFRSQWHTANPLLNGAYVLLPVKARKAKVNASVIPYSKRLLVQA